MTESEITAKSLTKDTATQLAQELMTKQERMLIQEGLDRIDQGISIFDSSLKLVAVNARMLDLLGFPREFGRPGTPLEEFFRYNAKRGEYGPGDVEQLVSDRIARARLQQAHRFQRVRPDGRVLEIRGTPLEHFGFVTTYTDITSTVRAAAVLETSRQRFQDMARAASDWFWEMDKDLNFTYVSERFYSAVGVPPEAILGKHRGEIADPGDVAQHQERWAAYGSVLAQRMPFRDFEYVFRGAEGRLYDLKVSGVPVWSESGEFTGYRGTGTDITAVKQTERALRESENRARSILEASPVGIAVARRRDGAILFANLRLAELLTTTREQLVGRCVNDYASEPSVWAGVMERYDRKGGVKDAEVCFTRHDGSNVWTLATLSNVAFEGDECALIWIYDITELRNSRETLARLATHDPLTGLRNRLGFQSDLERALARVKRHGGLGALLYLDLDGFKGVNDAHGHDCGDRLLVEVAERLRAKVRAHDVLARLGGDEFVLLVEDLKTPAQVQRIARKLIAAVTEPFSFGGSPIAIGASAGVALFDSGSADGSEVLKRADQAMYEAKSAGKGGFRIAAAVCREDYNP